MANGREWLQVRNRRDYPCYYYEGAHVNLKELRQLNSRQHYLRKRNIPPYPKYVFQEPNVCHVTERSGLYGIFNDGGFRGGTDGFLWWGLSIPDDSKYKEEFSEEFATSPAFQTTSLYGNFRFTFYLTELLKAYSKQYCYRTSPILRVLDTKLYKQEIVYSVLVHPKYMMHYRRYPRLPVDTEHLCGYSQKTMTWHCQSPSDNYKYHLKRDERYVSPLKRTEYFVWDNVAVAFHMEKNWVLGLGHKQLFNHLSVCETASNRLLREPEMSVYEAAAEVQNLKRMFNL